MTEIENKIKLTVQKRIVLFSVILFVAKVVAYYMTNSIGILTDALESTVNVLTGFVSLYSISVALKPKDKNHPFGHGKIESLSASVEGILIVIAGLVIIYEAVKRFFTPADIQQLDIGIIIVAIAGIINYILGYYSIRTGKKHGSIALIAGGKHLQSDTYSTIGLVIGLIVLYFTKMAWLDSVIAIIFGLVIIITGFKILKETTANLMDEADFEVLENITNILWDKKHETWIDLHNLKLVKYGNELHIDCDLTMPWYFDIRVAHKESDVIKELILKHYNDRIDFTIHLDPCKPEQCVNCAVKICEHRNAEFNGNILWGCKKG